MLNILASMQDEYTETYKFPTSLQTGNKVFIITDYYVQSALNLPFFSFWSWHCIITFCIVYTEAMNQRNEGNVSESIDELKKDALRDYGIQPIYILEKT